MIQNTTEIKAIVFDCFGVLVPDFNKQLLASATYSARTVEHINELRRQTDLGEISDSKFRQEFERITGIDYSLESRVKNAKKELNHKLLGLIKQLKPNYKIGMLSNATAPHLKAVIKACALKDYFDLVLISSKLGAVKPEPRIFEILVKKLRVKFNKTIFIDDTKENIKSASALGIRGVLYTNPAKLKEDLRDLLI